MGGQWKSYGGNKRCREPKKKRQAPEGRPAGWAAWATRGNTVSTKQE